MKRNVKAIIVMVCIMPLVCGALLGSCPLRQSDFVKISENGFDTAGVIDRNTYAWSMTYFEGNDLQKQNDGYVYVGTGNNIRPLIGANFGVVFGQPFDNTLVTPPEIWRSLLNDADPTWEKVFDYRDVEDGPPFNTVGFRYMTTYTPPGKNGTEYIYAGTYGVNPSIWRSSTGDSSSWEMVWEGDIGGSVRWLQVHDGILYFTHTKELILSSLAQSQLWATDGTEFWLVNGDGFGNPNNLAIACLNSFNGWLYAGLANYVDGAEIWKIRDDGDKSYTFQRVVSGGGPDIRNEIFGSTAVFCEKIYFGTLIFAGFNALSGNALKGADLICIDADDNWQTIVGEGGLSGWGSGFDTPLNAYLWQLAEHDGWLYAGTWDMGTIVAGALEAQGIEGVADFIQLVIDLITGGESPFKGAEDGEPLISVDQLLWAGGDLYCSKDGIHWQVVTLNGLGNKYNDGFRRLNSIGDYLYVGTPNPWEGLEVWRGTTPHRN